MSKYTEDDLREELKTKEYEYGFYTDIDSETFPVGLNEAIVRAQKSNLVTVNLLAGQEIKEITFPTP